MEPSDATTVDGTSAAVLGESARLAPPRGRLEGEPWQERRAEDDLGPAASLLAPAPPRQELGERELVSGIGRGARERLAEVFLGLRERADRDDRGSDAVDVAEHSVGRGVIVGGRDGAEPQETLLDLERDADRLVRAQGSGLRAAVGRPPQQRRGLVGVEREGALGDLDAAPAQLGPGVVTLGRFGEEVKQARLGAEPPRRLGLGGERRELGGGDAADGGAVVLRGRVGCGDGGAGGGEEEEGRGERPEAADHGGGILGPAPPVRNGTRRDDFTERQSGRERILFVSEAVTLAQVVRLLTLARALDPTRYEVHFACASFDERPFAGTGFRRHVIRSRSPREVEQAVARGGRPYRRGTLARYLEDDLRVLDRVEPRLVVGDLRWSLLVAAPLRGVPHAALANAYWSPWAIRRRYPLPDHPIVRLLGERLAAQHFPVARPWVFRRLARPLDALRARHGLPPLGGLEELLVAGDLTLYADVPELAPTRDLPPSHRYLGPVLWSPDVPLPPWWDALDPRRPSIYVTLGSSGRVETLPRIVAALARLDADVLVATAGRTALGSTPPNVHVAELLPGHLAARRSAVVVCNGGSSTGYQALAGGRPVVGLPWNLDQYLAMTAIEDAGAGRLVRGGTADPDALTAAVREALAGRFAAGVERARRALCAADAAARFRAVVDEVCGVAAGRSA